MYRLSDWTSVQCLQDGLHLRLSYFPLPAYISNIEDDETGEVKMLGVIPQQILPFVLGSLNITYEFIVSDQISHGAPVVNGTWPGEMGLLQDKVADMCVGAQYIDYDHALQFCPLESYERIPVKFLASYGMNEIFDFFTFLYQVEKMIWFLLLIAFVLMVTLSSAFDTMNIGHWKTSVFFQNAWKSMWIYLASIFCEGSPRTMSSRRGQLLQFIWLFAVLVLVNVLYSQFKGILMVTQRSNYLRTVEDLVRTPNMYPLILQNSVVEYILRDSPLQAFRRVYERGLLDPETCFIEGSEILNIDTYQMVKDGSHVLLTSVSLTKFILKDICNILTGNRKLYFVDEEITYIDIAFYTNWGFPEYLRNVINQRFLTMKESGLMDPWFSKYIRDFKKCEESDQSGQDGNTLLKLKHLSSAFVLYFYIHFLSLVVLVFEKVFEIGFKKKGL